MFGNIGFPELLLIFIIALLVFGPKKLPEVGRQVGRAIREFNRAKEGIKDKFEQGLKEEERKEPPEEQEKSGGTHSTDQR